MPRIVNNHAPAVRTVPCSLQPPHRHVMQARSVILYPVFQWTNVFILLHILHTQFSGKTAAQRVRFYHCLPSPAVNRPTHIVQW